MVWKRIAQKLRWIILLRFGLIAFRIHFGKARKSISFWGNIISGHFKMLKLEHLESVGKDGAETSRRSVQWILQILNMRSIAIKNHEMEIWWCGINIFQKINEPDPWKVISFSIKGNYRFEFYFQLRESILFSAKGIPPPS